MEGWFSRLRTTARTITAKGLDEIGGSLAGEGHVLFSCRAPVGKVALPQSATAFNQGCKALVPKTGMNSDYLAFQIATIRRAFEREALGTTFSEISSGAMKSIKLIRPPLCEQEAIVPFLDKELPKFDNLISEQELFVALLEERLLAEVTFAVSGKSSATGPTRDSGEPWLGLVPEHWTVCSLRYYASVKNGTTPTDSPEYWDGGTVPWVSSGEVNQYLVLKPSDFITEAALKRFGLCVFPRGAVLIGMIGQGKTRAMSAILGISATINQNVAAVVTKPKLLPAFLHYSFQAAYGFLRECGRGGNQAALNCHILASFRIALPPVDEQAKIVHHLDALRSTITEQMAESRRAIQLTERRAALISAAVTGKIDVRRVAPNLQEAA